MISTPPPPLPPMRPQTLSVAPLSGPNARCVLCGDLLDDCVCAFDITAPSIFATPAVRLAAEGGRVLAHEFDLSNDDLEEE